MKDYTIFNGRKLDGDVRQELEKKDKEIKELKEELDFFAEKLCNCLDVIEGLDQY
jgi:hypothetical protein